MLCYKMQYSITNNVPRNDFKTHLFLFISVFKQSKAGIKNGSA